MNNLGGTNRQKIMANTLQNQHFLLTPNFKQGRGQWVMGLVAILRGGWSDITNQINKLPEPSEPRKASRDCETTDTA